MTVPIFLTMSEKRVFKYYVSILFLFAMVECKRVVNTPSGRLVGTDKSRTITDVRDSVVQFLNVKYGTIKARFGESRGRPPTKQQINTEEFGKICYQSLPIDLDDGSMPTSRRVYLENLRKLLKNEPGDNNEEDCLNMNIYVPGNAFATQKRKYATVVIVHGDSFDYGSGNIYDGSILAGFGEVIVVTLNYRLGVFGFLSFGINRQKRPIEGNVGLGDIHTAIIELRKLLGSLGGDANKITLLGFGTGAALVEHLMSSKLMHSQKTPLFRRAILIGGSAYSSWGTVDNPAENSERLARGLNCTEGKLFPEKEDLFLSSESIIKCIRKKTIRQLKKATQNIRPPLFRNTFGPSVDNRLVIEPRKRTDPEYSELYRKIDLLVGTNGYDGSDYMPQNYLDIYGGVSVNERDNVIRTLVRNCYDFHRSEIFKIINYFYLDRLGPAAMTAGRRQLSEDLLNVITDSLFTAPSMSSLDLHSIRNNKTYLMTYEGNLNTINVGRSTVRPSHGGHLQEIPYLLGYPLMPPKTSPYGHFEFSTMQTRRVSLQLMSIVSGFANNGNPNSQLSGNVDWQLDGDWLPYSTKDRNFVLLSDTRKDKPQIQRLPFYQPKMLTWNQVVPILNQPGLDGTYHNMLKYDFTKERSSFFGEIRPFGGSYLSPLMLPSPRLPPAPGSGELETVTELQSGGKNGSASGISVDMESSGPDWRAALGIIVAVGSAFLILNLLICSVVYHTWEKKRRQGYKMEQQQQYSGTTGYDYRGGDNTTNVMMNTTGPNTVSVSNVGGTNFIMGSPPALGSHGTSMPPPPPPPHLLGPGGVSSNGISAAGTAAGMVDSSDAEFHQGMAGSLKSFHQHHVHHSHPHGQTSAMASSDIGLPATGHLHNHQFAEQEPLLRNTISPMCPRHSKQAQMTTTRGMDEIQV